MPKVRVIVTMQDQQFPMVERVMAEGTWGTSPAEVIHNVFLDWYKKTSEGVVPISVTGAERDT